MRGEGERENEARRVRGRMRVREGCVGGRGGWGEERGNNQEVRKLCVASKYV